MENQNENKESRNEIKPGDLLSFPYASKYLQGICLDIKPDTILIDSKREGQIQIPNDKNVYKFFPGQKFDLREFNIPDLNSTEKLSVAQRLSSFLSKTTVGSYENFAKNHKNDLIQILTGKLTHNLYSGNTLVNNEETGIKEMKNWQAKFQVYRHTNGSLKLYCHFKKEKQDLTAYGVEVTPEEKQKLLEKKQTIVLERSIEKTIDENKKEKTNFKVFARYDNDLNSLVITPYNEEVEKKLKAAYELRESQSQAPAAQGQTPTSENKNIFKEKLDELNKKDSNSKKAGLQPKQDIKGNKGKKVS